MFWKNALLAGGLYALLHLLIPSGSDIFGEETDVFRLVGLLLFAIIAGRYLQKFAGRFEKTAYYLRSFGWLPFFQLVLGIIVWLWDVLSTPYMPIYEPFIFVSVIFIRGDLFFIPVSLLAAVIFAVRSKGKVPFWKNALLAGGLYEVIYFVTSIYPNVFFDFLGGAAGFIFLFYFVMLVFNSVPEFLQKFSLSYPQTAYYLRSFGWLPFLNVLLAVPLLVWAFRFRYQEEVLLSILNYVRIYVWASGGVMLLSMLLALGIKKKNAG